MYKEILNLPKYFIYLKTYIEVSKDISISQHEAKEKIIFEKFNNKDFNSTKDYEFNNLEKRYHEIHSIIEKLFELKIAIVHNKLSDVIKDDHIHAITLKIIGEENNKFNINK